MTRFSINIHIGISNRILKCFDCLGLCDVNLLLPWDIVQMPSWSWLYQHIWILYCFEIGFTSSIPKNINLTKQFNQPCAASYDDEEFSKLSIIYQIYYKLRGYFYHKTNASAVNVNYDSFIYSITDLAFIRSSVQGKCGSDFKSTIFKLITWNGSLCTCWEIAFRWTPQHLSGN